MEKTFYPYYCPSTMILIYAQFVNRTNGSYLKHFSLYGTRAVLDTDIHRLPSPLFDLKDTPRSRRTEEDG